MTPLSDYCRDADDSGSGLLNLVEAATALTELVRTVRVATTTSVEGRETHDISDDDELSSPAKVPSSDHASGLFVSECSELDSKLTKSAKISVTLHVTDTNNKEIFPQRLMHILSDPSIADTITWLPHGRSFLIVQPEKFTEKILPKYFPESRGNTSVLPHSRNQGTSTSTTACKYPSFTRKLNRWGFRQVSKGPDAGAFHHRFFRRGEPELCLKMVCEKSRRPKMSKTDTSRRHDLARTPVSLCSRQPTTKRGLFLEGVTVTDTESVASGTDETKASSLKKRKYDGCETLQLTSFPSPLQILRSSSSTLKPSASHLYLESIQSCTDVSPACNGEKCTNLNVYIQTEQLNRTLKSTVTHHFQRDLDSKQPNGFYTEDGVPKLKATLLPYNESTLLSSIKNFPPSLQTATIESSEKIRHKTVLHTDAHLRAEAARNMLYKAYMQALAS